MPRFVIQGERPSARQAHAKAGEEVPAHHVRGSLFRLLAKAHGNLADGQRHEGCEVGKHVVAGPQLLEAREIKCVAGIPGLGGRGGHSCRIEMDQLAGIRHRQESQPGGIHHAEHGGVGADAERERYHGDGSEAGVLREHPQAISKVLK